MEKDRKTGEEEEEEKEVVSKSGGHKLIFIRWLRNSDEGENK